MMPMRPWPDVGQEETKLGGKNASNSAFLLKSSVGEIARNEFRKQQWIQFSKKHFLIYWQMQLFCTVLSKGMIETNSHCAHESINLGLIANSGTLWNLSALVTYFLWPRIQVNDSEREFYAYTRCNIHRKTRAVNRTGETHTHVFISRAWCKRMVRREMVLMGFPKENTSMSEPLYVYKTGRETVVNPDCSELNLLFLRRTGEWEY